MQQVLLIQCLALFFGLMLYPCSVCTQQIQRVCVKVQNNTNCEWTDKTVNYDIQQQKYGIVYIKMPLLIACNNNSNFAIELSVDETVSSPEKCNQDYKSGNKTARLQDWKVHSKVKIDINCDKYMNNNVPLIKFDYVFTGCYKIVIKSIDMNEHESNPVYISTEYKKKLLTDAKTITVTPIPVKGGELDVIVRINSNDVIKPPNIKTSLIESGTPKKNSLIGILAIKCNGEKGCKTFSQSFEVDESYPNATFNCICSTEFHDNVKYICRYKGLNPGRYAFRYDLLHEYPRCQLDSEIWGNDARCEGIVREIDVPELDDVEVIYTKTTYGQDIYYCIPVIIILTVFGLYGVVYGYRRIQKYRHNSPTQKLGRLIEILHADDKQEILLIWSRDLIHSNQFGDIVTELKKLLQQGRNVSVLDINELNEEISINPTEWIINKIEDPKIKVILFLNIWSICFYKKHPSKTYENEECQDKLFKSAVVQLQISPNRSKENLFVLQLNSFPSNDTIFSSLYTERKYIMPNDIQTLLRVFPLNNQEVYNQETLINDFWDSCWRYEQLCGNIQEYFRTIFLRLH